MLYLLYLKSGFIKKFPLNKKNVTIGRSSKNDLVFDESFVSQKHARITVERDYIIVEDLGSTNGIFIDQAKIYKAKIEVNQYFRIGYINIFLKTGNAQDLVISKKIQPILNKISRILTGTEDKTQEAVRFLYAEPMIEMLQIGFGLEEFRDIFLHAKKLFHQTLKEGCLLLIINENKNNIIESKWNYDDGHYPYIMQILQREDVFEVPQINKRIAQSFYYCSFPFVASSRAMLLVYLLKSKNPIETQKIEFLKDLSVEISIIDSLIEQNRKKSLLEKQHPAEIITSDQAMLNLLSKCRKIADSDLFVIIEGESGTGKELIARFIHSNSKQSRGNFVALNCAAIPENLMEDELFGHEKGAFTDAKNQRKGKLELSSGGTLVLDEIGDMPLSLQKKLLRAIQEEQFYRIGGNQPIHVRLRIICLTNTKITDLVEKKIFREDLYYRLNHVTLRVMPLRERKEDLIPLINHFIKMFSLEVQTTIKGFTREAIRAMESYDWPGNVRELKNEMKKILSLADQNDIVDVSMLKDTIVDYGRRQQPQAERISDDQKKKIISLLEKHRWNKTLVAREMNISRTALYQKLEKYNLK